MEKISEILFIAIVSLVSLSIIASGTPDFMSNEARAKELGIGSLEQGSNTESGASSSEPITVSKDSVIVSISGQSVPLETYQNSIGNYLWIENAQEWAQFASIPQYSPVPLIAYTPTGGRGEIYEIYPNGMTQKAPHDFLPGYNPLRFIGDAPGEHIMLFVVNNQSSNGIVLNVGD